MSAARQPLLGQSHVDLRQLLDDLDEPSFRAKQLFTWLHRHRCTTLDEITVFSKALRSRLAAAAALRTLQLKDRRSSPDRLTEKVLFATHDGQHVESVLIIEKRQRRHTVCLSSMIGCPLACTFCATGQGRYVRNLTAAEMVEQVYALDTLHRQPGEDRAIDNVVFMGMGEPLLNLDHVLQAAALLANPEGMHLSGRHITLSTVGVIPGIRELAKKGTNFRLTVSLHAANQQLREQLIPAARQWPLDALKDAMTFFAAGASRDITIAYCLIGGVNDTPEHAAQLSQYLRGLPCKVNLIPLNPTQGYRGNPPDPQAVRLFQQYLEGKGHPVTVRQEKGQSIRGACGQLREEAEKDPPCASRRRSVE